MALSGTLAEFKNLQQNGLRNLDFSQVKNPQRILESPSVDSYIKDAVKVDQYSSANIPTVREDENIMEKVLSGSKPITTSFITQTPLAEKLNNTLAEKYQSLRIEKEDLQVPFIDEVDPTRDSSYSFSEFKKHLGQKESDNNYKLTNKNSSAAGKYQFLYNTWKGKIQQITGIASKTDFLNNPKAQEKFFQWYTDNEVLPQAKKLQKEAAKKGFSLSEVAKLIHFRGATGAKNLLKWDSEKYKTRDSKNNMGVYEYLGRDRQVKKGGR